ncbi:MAG: biosynthetic-type acetolactate synthase large subunit [Patescibacteria group bacterium]|nr:biosynthetic-type acetolactate synthase large subunit [Patescibacteria group bacterium]
MKVTGAEALMKTLVDLGIDTIFGYPGGAIMPVYDALYGYTDKIRHILVRHEQGAAHAAEGYARITGKPGVCMATSGPGATNLVTGIADAMMDSVPLLAITGQVHQALIGTDAFQETDIIGITTPITKWNFQVTSASELAEAVVKGYRIAMEGRPGPVLIDITKNAQFEETEYHFPTDVRIEGFQPVTTPNPRQIQIAAELINKAERPFLVFGHGVLIARATQELIAFAEKSGIPVANTLHGLSGFPSAHPLYMGWVGMHGNYATNVLTNQADVLIGIGMRFDDRVTGRLDKYAKQAKVIHIDIDPAELNKNVHAEVPIVADAKNALIALTKAIKKREHSAWIARFAELRQQEVEQIIKPNTEPKDDKVRMAEVIHRLSQKTKGEAVIVPDVGQHQMIAARYYQFTRPDSFISSGGAGTMGFGLPAAMGAKVAAPEREVICIAGDGGFQMTSHEMMTISAENIPVKVLVLNNNFLGMVRQWQQLFFERRYSFVDIKNPDFVKMAESYFVPAEKVTDRAGIDAALDRMLAAKGPYFVEVVCEKEENVFPMIPSGAAIDEIRLS